MPAPRLESLAVAAAVAARTIAVDPIPELADSRPSAVLALIADGPDGAEILLTRRSMDLRSHRGEVSFPGGRLDPGETYEDAALREAWEEVGIPPAAVELVGRLQPMSTLITMSWIVPIVGRLAAPVELVVHAGEVDRALWVPLHDFTEPGTFREELWPRLDAEHPIYFFELDDETVWGATARMLFQLLRVAYGVDDHSPPAG